MTIPVLGQPVTLKTQASPLRVVSASVTKVIDADTVSLVAFIDSEDDWPVSNIPYQHPAQLYENVARGTGVGQWQEASLPAQAGAVSTVSLALNTPRQPNTDRATRVTISGTWSWTLNAVGTATGTVALKTDSSATPTTVVITMPFSRGIGVGISVNDAGTECFCWTFEVRAGDYYEIVTTNVAGGGAFGATPLVVEQTL